MTPHPSITKGVGKTKAQLKRKRKETCTNKVPPPICPPANRGKIGIIRHLPVDDPRNPNHPSHDDKWLELARSLGRAMADFEWDRLNGPNGKTK